MFGDVLLAGNSRILSIPNEDITRPLFYSLPFGFGELRKGHLVLWNPYNYAGLPFLGAFGHALLYPPHWLHMFLAPALGIDVEIALHLFLAGVFVYLWTSHRRLHPAACILAGLVFMFSGAVFLQIYRGHLHCIISLTWAPLIMLAIDGVLDGTPRPSPRVWTMIGMVAVAMQILSGHVQYTFYTAIIAGIYALLRWLTASRRLRDVLCLAMIYAGGASLAAVQLFTGLQAASEGYRTSISYDVAASFAFPPENVLTLIFPGFFGDMVSTPYWGRWTLTEMSLFMGVCPFVIAVCALVHGAKGVRRFSLLMAVIVLVLAFGDYTPLFRLLYDHVPGFQNFRGTTKFTFLALLFLSMLVAVGFDYLLRSRVPRWLAVSAFLTSALLTAGGLALASDCRSGGRDIWTPTLSRMSFLAEAYQSFIVERATGSLAACQNASRSLWITAGTLAVFGALSVAARRWHRLVYVIGLVGVIELMAYARYTRPTFDPTPLAERSVTLRRLLDERDAGDARILSYDPYSYIAMGARAYDLWGAEPALLGRYARFVALTQRWPTDAILVTSGMRTPTPLLGMLRLRYLLRMNAEQMTLLPTNLPQLPRAALISNWNVLPDSDHVLAALQDTTFDPTRIALLEHDPGLTPSGSEEPGQISIHDLSTEEIDITVDAPQPSILVISDNYSASWKAAPLDPGDTRSYVVEPADYLLRAIPLPAGHHHIRLEYRPSALILGTWVTVSTIAACLVVLALEWRRVRKR
jgi:hypothetical protein